MAHGSLAFMEFGILIRINQVHLRIKKIYMFIEQKVIETAKGYIKN